MPEPLQTKDKLVNTAGYLIAIGFIGIGALGAHELWSSANTLPLQVASALFYIIGRVADNISTIKVIESINKHEEVSGELDHHKELNLFLPARPTKRDLLSPRYLTIEGCGLITTIVSPPLGALYGIFSFIAAGSNTLLHKEINK